MKLILIISFLCLTFSTQNDKLIFVMIHFRHGARASNHLESTKIDKIGEYWENDGELTGVGERMHYLLGLRNRLRYIKKYNFLSEKYNSTEIKAICSLRERSQKSLSSHLQGLYPPNENLGENLNLLQLERSDPPVNISDSTIEHKKINLNNDSLPNSMIFIPFEIVDILGLKSCRGSGSLNIQSVYDLSNEFYEKYKEKFNQFQGIEKDDNYTFKEVTDICSDFISDYVDGRKMSKFSTIFDLEEFYEYCLRQFSVAEGESKITANETEHAFGTYFMELLINYTKLKINEDLGLIDSTNPKMLIVSGHDTTVNTHQFFMQLALEGSKNYFRNPTFASQMAFEINRNDDNKQNRNYSDYFINYYFNDELIWNMTVDKFFNIMEPHIMSSNQVNAICNLSNNNGYNNNSNGNQTNNNGNNNQTEEIVKYITVKNDKYHNELVIVFASLFGVSLIINVFTIYKLLDKNKNLEQKENVESSITNIQNSKNIQYINN